MPLTGADQLRAVSRDLKVAGTPARGLRRSLRREITAAMTPMKQAVQTNALAIPAAGVRSTGLRSALARATKIRISTAVKTVLVRLIVDGARMPAGQQALPQLVEGERQWRHPVFGEDTWVVQPSHPIVAPAIPATVARATVGVEAAITSTAKQLSTGI